MRAVWFLDVDGVINALSPLQARHADEFPVWDEKRVNGYRIRYAPELVEFINKMSSRVDIKWNTTWQNQAVEFLSPALGLETFDVVNAEGVCSPGNYVNHLSHNRWWKLNTVLTELETGSVDFIIWTDDHMTTEVRNYLRRKADFEGVECCLITPDPEMGITRKDMERIEGFVDAMEKYSTV